MKGKMAKTFNARNLTVTGLMMALTIVATIIIRIPIPATEGFVNIGDSVILITAYFFGGFPAILAGGIGSMLADILSGYAHWAPFTLMIKGLEGLICGLLFWLLNKKCKYNSTTKIIGTIVACVISVVFMALGYFVVEIFMYGLAPAAFGIPFNLLQGGVSAVIALIVIAALKNVKINFKKKAVISTLEQLEDFASKSESENNDDTNEDSTIVSDETHNDNMDVVAESGNKSNDETVK